MEFNTRENRIRSKPEMNSGKTMVDFAGYISKRKRIEAIMSAGERLVQARREMYDYVGEEDDPEIPIDPTRRKNFDLSEASELAREIDSRLRSKKNSTAASAAGPEKKLEEILTADQKLEESKKAIEK